MTDIDPEGAKALAVLAYTGALTEGLSGTIIENPDVGVKRAKCPVCPHVIDVVGVGFAVQDTSDDDRSVIMCGRCSTFLFVTPPGFTPISDEEFAKLPHETRTILERTRERVKSYRSLIT